MIRRGYGGFSEVIAILDGNSVKRGCGGLADVVATIDGNRVRSGCGGWSQVIATTDGNSIRKDFVYGQVMFTVEGSASTVEKGALAAAALVCL
jgi:hypothetical protein